MERLDQGYLNELAGKAKGGDSNAFAELFAAVAPRQYIYLQYMFSEKEEALAALREVFSQALNQLPQLNSPALFMPWISRLSFRQYLKASMPEAVDRKELPTQLARIQHLPLAESQVLLMYQIQHLNVSEIGAILNYANRTVKRFLKLAKRHLALGGTSGEEDELTGHDSGARRFRMPDGRMERKLGLKTSVGMLADIFDQAGQEPNTIPLEELTSYFLEMAMGE